MAAGGERDAWGGAEGQDEQTAAAESAGHLRLFVSPLVKTRFTLGSNIKDLKDRILKDLNLKDL